MKILIHAKLPHEPFNTFVKDGTAGAKLNKIIEAIKPEAAYFTEFGGKRTGIFIVDLPDASKIPSIAEPFFLTFQADVEFHPVMTPADLQKAGIDQIGKQWS